MQVPAGSYDSRFYEGRVWVTQADGAQITAVAAATGAIVGTTGTGPGPRFLASGGGSIWTLNQGDGTLTRVDIRSRKALRTVALGTPGHGGDITFAAGLIWTTMWKVSLSAVDTTDSKLLCQWVGPGGDSLGIGHDAIWLTDYHGGTISRLELQDALNHCTGSPRGQRLRG